MGTTSVRLDEGLYRRIKAHKREDETFPKTIAGLIDYWTVLAYDTGRFADEIDRHREAIRATEEADIEDTDGLLERTDGASDSP